MLLSPASRFLKKGVRKPGKIFSQNFADFGDFGEIHGFGPAGKTGRKCQFSGISEKKVFFQKLGFFPHIVYWEKNAGKSVQKGALYYVWKMGVSGTGRRTSRGPFNKCIFRSAHFSAGRRVCGFWAFFA